MAISQRKEAEPKVDREMLRKLLALPLDQFRAARAKRSPAEREALERLWQEENAEAIADYNRYIEENGIPLAEFRQF
jgi:antitoxin CcdA